MKVAIVHDWLVGGGAERVVYELHKLYPDAPIYTSYCTREWRKKLDGKVVTGWLQYWPFSVLRKFLPVLRIIWFGRLKLNGYDVVISSSGNGEAKSVKVPAGTTHICYCHSPTHFYWRHYDEYLRRPGFGFFDPLARFGLRILVGPLRRWDYRAAQRPDYFIANSTHIKNDIKKFYGRDATVIFPPVDTKRFAGLPDRDRRGFVTVGRLKPYKHVDSIVEACTRLGLHLTVIGSGPHLPVLKRLAGSEVVFLDHADDDEVNRQLSGAEAFLFASFEDFGITPVEALAAGTPVIAYRAGGALDYVIPGKNGLFFDEQTAESLMDALERFSALKFYPHDVRQSALRFSVENFRDKMRSFVETHQKPTAD
mgnify:CR=1 FL=1